MRLGQCEQHRDQLWHQNYELSKAQTELRESTPARDHHIKELEANCKAAAEEKVALVLENCKLAKSKDFEITLLKTKTHRLEQTMADQELKLKALEEHEESMVRIVTMIRKFEKGKLPRTTLDDVKHAILDESTEDNARLLEAIATSQNFGFRNRDELTEAKQELLRSRAEIQTKIGEIEKLKKALYDRGEEIFKLGLEINEMLPKKYGNEISDKAAIINGLKDRLKRLQSEVAFLEADPSAPETVVVQRQHCRGIDKLEKELNDVKEKFGRLQANYDGQTEALDTARYAFYKAEEAQNEDAARYEQYKRTSEYLFECEISPNVHILVEHVLVEQKKREIAEEALADLQSKVQDGHFTQQNQNAQDTEGIQQNQAPYEEQDIEQGQDNEQHQDVEEYQHDLRENDDWEDVTGSSISEAGSPVEVKPSTGSLSTTSIDELGHTEYRLQEPSSEQAPNEDQAHEESRYREDLSHEEVASRDGDSSW